MRQADPTAPLVGDEGRYPAEMRAAPRAIWPWAVEQTLWPWPMPEKARVSPSLPPSRPPSIAPAEAALRRGACDGCGGRRQVHWTSGTLLPDGVPVRPGCVPCEGRPARSHALPIGLRADE